MTIDIDIDDDSGSSDEIALPRFEERLRHRLTQAHHEHSAAAHAARSGEHTHRRRAKRSLTFGAGAIATAAALVVAVLALQPDGSSGGDEVSDSATASGPPSSEIITRVIAATDEAVATSVVHVVQDNSTSDDSESWIDETSGASRDVSMSADGEPSFDSAEQDGVRRSVDHCFAEYTEGEPGLPSVAGSATVWVQSYLADGLLVEDGTQIVDGRELIRLREVPPSERDPDSEPGADVRARADQAEAAQAQITPEERQALEDAAEAAEEAARAATPPTTSGEQDAPLPTPGENATPPTTSGDQGEPGVTLVDPETYRPVMVVGYPGTEYEYVQTYEYLPRTPGNLAHLVAPVPDGFTRVESLRGDGERADAGCS